MADSIALDHLARYLPPHFARSGQWRMASGLGRSCFRGPGERLDRGEVLCKRPAARSSHAGMDEMTASLCQGSEHAGQIVCGWIAVTNKEVSRAGIGTAHIRAIRCR